MTRWSLLLSALVAAVVLGLPLVYADARHRAFRNFRVVEEGELYRSGQMTPAGFQRVCREKGIKTVIILREANEDKPDDVRAVAEERRFCEGQTPPIAWKEFEPRGWEEENGRVPMEANLREFEKLLDDPEQYPRPILVHCFAGIHRTGTHVAVYRVKENGYTPAEAMAELKSCGKPTTTYVGNLVPFLWDEGKHRGHLGELFKRVHGRPVGVPVNGR